MKKITDIITADNPERYAIRFNKPGKKSIYCVLLQIAEDNKFILTEFREAVTSKSKCKVLAEGEIEDFCTQWHAIDNGIMLSDIALLRFFNDNYKY